MKTYINLTNGTAWGSGKAFEFKSQSSKTPSLRLVTSFRSGVSSSRSHGQSSHELRPSSIGHENHNHAPAKTLARIGNGTSFNDGCEEVSLDHTGSIPVSSQEGHSFPLSSILEDLGVFYIGN